MRSTTRKICPSVPSDECKCLGCYQSIQDLIRIIQARSARHHKTRRHVPLLKTQRDRRGYSLLYPRRLRSASKRARFTIRSRPKFRLPEPDRYEFV